MSGTDSQTEGDTSGTSGQAWNGCFEFTVGRCDGRRIEFGDQFDEEVWDEFRGACRCIDGSVSLQGLSPNSGWTPSVLEEIDGSLSVTGGLARLDGMFPQLRVITGDIGLSDIQASSDPTTILHNVETVSGALRMSSVVSLEHLDHVESVEGSLVVDTCGSTGDLTSLVRVGGLFRLVEQPGSGALPPLLASVGGLDVVDSFMQSVIFQTQIEIAGDFQLINNERIQSIRGYELVESVGGSVRIEGNPSLPDCEVLALAEHLSALGFTGDFVACGNGQDECSASLPPCPE